ncbi:MAG: hypothetical protein JO246_08120, partial [Frankiaceae bacterium]|nr:hypothetical protein [Frankiaceae bacterium]
TEVTAPTVGGANSAAAYGDAIFAGPNGDTILGIDANGKASTLYTAPKVPVAVAAFGLSAGRLVDADTHTDPAHPSHALPLRERAVDSDGNTLTVGEPVTLDPANDETLHDADSNGLPQHLATSGATTAYFINDPISGVDLRIVTATQAMTIAHVNDPILLLSGNRVYYRSALPADQDYHLLNLATGQNTDATLMYGAGSYTALWGNYLLYLVTEPTRSLHRMDLSTGIDTILPTASPVGEYGDFVVTQNRDAITITNVATDSHSTFKQPKDSPYSLTAQVSSSGVVYPTTAAWILHTWDGTALPLIAQADLEKFEHPEVDGNVYAWIGHDSNLHAAPVAVSRLAPRGLGAPVAPTEFIRASEPRWDASIPYSQPLTSCTVTITSLVTTVRTLPCEDREASFGVASVSWDGNDSHGDPVAPGAYTWTVTAAGDGGDALDAAGKDQPVSGTVTVS